MIEQIKNGKIFFRAGKERKIAVKEHVKKLQSTEIAMENKKEKKPREIK